MRARALLLLLAAWPSAAWGEEDVVKEAARTLAYEGIELYEKGQPAQALDRLDRAAALVRAPTLSLWRARSLSRLGRLLEADTAYAEAAAFELPEGADAALIEARDAARKERAALDPQIPRLVVEVRGVPAVAVRARAGSRSVTLGKELRVDPGEVRVVAEARGKRAEQAVQLRAGETRRVVLAIAIEPVRPTPPPTGPAPRAAPVETGSGQRLAGWIALGVGGAGFLAGAGAGLYALAERSDLDGVCSGAECPPSESDRVDRYNGALTLSTVGFVIGGLGTAAGLTLLLTAPRTDRPRVGLWLGPAAAGVRASW